MKLGTIKTIVFDMDGTLYRLDGANGGFKNSTLHKKMTENAVNFIAQQERITPTESASLFERLTQKHSHPSLYLSEKYGISRKEFFDIVWNIDPEGIVIDYESAMIVIPKLFNLNKELILLTQAPSKWQNNVFNFLKFNNLFAEIFTGENYLDKPEIYSKVSTTREPKTILSVGDQLETDILPAQAAGFYTLHISTPNDLLKLLQDEQT